MALSSSSRISQYGANAASGSYARFLNKQRGARQMKDLQRDYKLQTPKVVSSFTQKGVAGPGVKSGIFNRGMSRFAEDSFTKQNDLMQALNQQDQMDGFTAAEQKFLFDAEMADIAAAKAQQIAEAAATLQSFKPFLS
jgi:hypothetical protein